VKTRKTAPEMLGRIIPPMPEYDYFVGADQVPFPAAKGEYSLEASWWLAETALVAYEQPNFIRNVMRLSGFPGFRFFSAKSTEAFVAHRPGLALVVFRGTEIKSVRTVLDVYTDAKFLKESFRGGFVHKGFKDGILKIWEGKGEAPKESGSWMREDGMRAYLDSLLAADPGMRVFFTGHSLGAALATLGACLFPAAAALYTFGSPMVGDAGFAASLSLPHYRWVNNRDLITFLPPPEVMQKVMKYSYVHSGQEYYLDDSGALAEPPDERSFSATMRGDIDKIMGALSDAFSSIEGFKGLVNMARGKERPDELPLVDTMIDHAPVNYAVKIWNLLC
jgi:pimeloyl-ACP methyl ester carboxylesterase